MKVKELIEWLKEFNEEAEIIINDGWYEKVEIGYSGEHDKETTPVVFIQGI